MLHDYDSKLLERSAEFEGRADFSIQDLVTELPNSHVAILEKTWLLTNPHHDPTLPKETRSKIYVPGEKGELMKVHLRTKGDHTVTGFVRVLMQFEKSNVQQEKRYLGLSLDASWTNAKKLGAIHPVVLALEFVKARGLEEEGILRESGLKTRYEQFIHQTLEQGVVQADIVQRRFEGMNAEIKPNDMVSVFKYYLMAMPDSLFTERMYLQIQDVDLSLPSTLEFLKGVIARLPEPNKTIFFLFMEVACLVRKNEPKNRMTANAIGVAVGPTIFLPIQMDATARLRESKRVVQLLEAIIENWSVLH